MLELLQEAHEWCAEHQAVVTYGVDENDNSTVEIKFNVIKDANNAVVKVSLFVVASESFLAAYQSAKYVEKLALAAHEASVNYNTDHEGNTYIEVNYKMPDNPIGHSVKGTAKGGPYQDVAKGFIQTVEAAQKTYIAMRNASKGEQ